MRLNERSSRGGEIAARLCIHVVAILLAVIAVIGVDEKLLSAFQTPVPQTPTARVHSGQFESGGPTHVGRSGVGL